MELPDSDRKQTSRRKAEQWLRGDGTNKWGRGNELQRAGYEATFVVDEYIYYPDCGDGSVGLCMCHSLVSHTLNLCS